MQNKWLRYGLIGVVGVLALCFVCSAGIFVGRLSLRRGLPAPIRFGFALFQGAHGAVGTIQKIDGQTITLVLRDGSTQTVQVSAGTRIERSGRQNMPLSALKPGDQVLVIGSPMNGGVIAARFIRLIGSRAAAQPWWAFFLAP